MIDGQTTQLIIIGILLVICIGLWLYFRNEPDDEPQRAPKAKKQGLYTSGELLPEYVHTPKSVRPKDAQIGPPEASEEYKKAAHMAQANEISRNGYNPSKSLSKELMLDQDGITETRYSGKRRTMYGYNKHGQLTGRFTMGHLN